MLLSQNSKKISIERFVLCYYIKSVTEPKMSVASYQNDVLNMFYGEIPGKKSLPRPLKPLIEIEDEFYVSTNNNIYKWLRVWKMVVSETNPHNKDLFEFARSIKESFTDLIKRELKELKNIKVSLEMKIKFKKEEEEKQTQYMEQYFRENEPQLFYAHDDEKKIEEYFDSIFEIINGKIEAWVAEGSGWEVDKISLCMRMSHVFSHCVEEHIYQFQQS